MMARREGIGDILAEGSYRAAKKIAEMKKDSMLGKNKKSRFREVVGTCVSMGVTVDGKDPKQVLKDIDKGAYAGIW